MICSVSQRQKRWLLNIFYHILLLWTKEMEGLANFSSYLFRIITSHSAQACDGERLRLHCPRHSSVSVQSAYYGYSAALRCSNNSRAAYGGEGDESCSVITALQKLLSECQGHRDCQLSVNSHAFGRDPCPGTSKYLQVSYKCKPTEHKRKVGCDGEHMTLHCKPPRVLNIYSAAYGRLLGEDDVCSSDGDRQPPFECSYHGAAQQVSEACYAKQRCVIAVDDQNFRDPCFPETRKYLTVLYACVPEALLKEADPNIFSPTSTPKQGVEPGVFPYPKGSRLPDSSGILLSNSLVAWAYIKGHPELVALLFVSSVCVGLLCALLAVSTRLLLRRARHPGGQAASRKRSEGSVDEESSEPRTSLLSGGGEKDQEARAADTAEDAELAERIERRDQVIQEIWMNSYLNGNWRTWSSLPGNAPVLG